MATVELLQITLNAEKLIEEAGRTCYQSGWKADETSEEAFIWRIVKSGHHSVLEHASATFKITGGSRVFTHQLVRHRLCNFSQQSQRYVDEKNLTYVTPPSIVGNPEALALFNGFMARTKDAYQRLQELGVKNEDARYVLPNATCSEIVVSANLRQWRHILCVRCDKHAQWEIRSIALQILKILKEKAPAVFGDFVINPGAQTAGTPWPS